MPIIATAGHVDHGKSTLVEALTGRDPDRWAEEKERGLTINLGFAWSELATGAMVGFVDVPGHERFMKNMLAGVGAIDVALFVVAADEGWMPQSEEHLLVLDLLGVRHGVIALTRTDLVDADTIEIAELEVGDQVQGTSLAEWPIVPVSPVTGFGLDAVRSALVSQLESAGPPTNVGRPRMWVDRSFVIAGAGVVVTGTLTNGPLRRGDKLTLFPGNRPVRVRGLQSHEAEVDTAEPGTRTAINLSGVDRDLVARGALLTGPGEVRAGGQALSDLQTVRGFEGKVTDRGAFHLHLGSGAWPVHVRPIDKQGIEGLGAALLKFDADVPMTMGDKFILREVGRRAVVAGGVVLDPAPEGPVSRLSQHITSLRSALSGSPDQRAGALLESRGIASSDELWADTGGGRVVGGVTSLGTVTSEAEAERLSASIESAARQYQQDNPLRAGAPKATIATQLRIPPELLEALVMRVKGLIDDGATVRTADHSGALGPEEKAAWSEVQTTLAGSGLAVPRASLLGLDPELLHALVRSGRLVQITPDLVYLPGQIDEVHQQLESLPDGFTVADFRDRLKISRRHAVPLLEWLDASGRTARHGDVRTVRKQSG